MVVVEIGYYREQGKFEAYLQKKQVESEAYLQRKGFYIEPN